MIPHELQQPNISLPLRQTLRHYRKRWLRSDMLAGMAVAAVAIPQGMAYAQLAGIPLIGGLYAAFVAMLVFAVFSSSRQVIVGPDAAMAALTGAVVIPMSTGDPAQAATYAALLAILIGLASLIGVFVRLGFIAEFLSRPILLGYMAGLALAVIGSQAPKMFGLETPTNLNFFGMIGYILTNLPDASVATMWLSVLLIVTSVLLQHYMRIIPVSLIVLIGATLASALFDFENHGIAVVGTIPSGLPLPSISFVEPVDLQNLIIPALAIMMVAYANTVAMARSFAAKQHEHVQSSQEYFGLGMSNIAAGVFSGMPVSASGARTALNASSRAKTQVSQLFGGAFIGIALLLLAPMLYFLPTAALAVIIVMAAAKLFDARELRSIWHAWRSEAILAIITVLGVTLLGILQGLILAVFLAIANLIRKSAFPPDAELGIGPDGRVHDIERRSGTHPLPGLVMYRFDAPLYFVNANHFRDRVIMLIQSSPDKVRWFLWDAETITTLDSTAATMLIDLMAELKSLGITFAIARMKSPLKKVVHESHHLSRRVHRAPHFPSIGLALDAYRAESAAQGLDVPPAKHGK